MPKKPGNGVAGIMQLLLKRVLVLLVFMTPTLYAYADDLTATAANKTLVVQFYTAAFIDKNLDVARSYLSDSYIQHNPSVKSGAQAFVDFFTVSQARNPHAKSEIKRVIAEGDLVVLHIMSKPQPDGPVTAIIDIFRVENGKVAEHWDVKQQVPDTVSVNGNSFF